MAVDFPDAPTIGQTFQYGRLTYMWDGVKWFVISTGGIDVSTADATEADVLSPKTFYAGAESNIKTGTIPSKSAETFMPGTADQTINSGQYLAGTQTILGDANLLPENIKPGVTIFGVTGITSFAPIQATGGTVTDVNIEGNFYRIHAFENTGNTNFLVTDIGSDGRVDVLIVGGGGGATSGGGGAGGLIYQSNLPIIATNFLITVGAGGAGNFPGATPRPQPAENGQNSTAFGLTALGGGGGAGTDFGGLDGGSGGGAAASSKSENGGLGGQGLQPTSASGGSGFRGGNVIDFGPPYYGAAGGGAGAPGGDDDGTNSTRDGGAGLYFGDKFTDNYGENGWFAGGGAGGGWQSVNTTGVGGIGGGGDGTVGATGQNGMANTGGGGGAVAGNTSNYGGDGGSGIVLIRYPLGEPEPTNYLSFDGVDDYVSIPNESEFESMSYLEVEVDIRNWQTTSTISSVVDKYWDNSDRSWVLELRSGQANFNVSTNEINANNNASFVLPGDNSEWITIKGIWNSQDNTTRIYLNGIEQNSVSVSGDTVRTNNSPLSLGSSWYANTRRFWFNGDIKNVKISNQNGIISHWLFNDGSGSTLTDSIGNNNGVIIGATWGEE